MIQEERPEIEDPEETQFLNGIIAKEREKSK